MKGTSKGTLIYGINMFYHLLKNDAMERRSKPYLTASAGITLTGGVKEETSTPDGSSRTRYTVDDAFDKYIGAGAGYLYHFSEKAGIKLQGGYNYVFDFRSPYVQEREFRLFKSHPYVYAGLRFRIAGE